LPDAGEEEGEDCADAGFLLLARPRRGFLADATPGQISASRLISAPQSVQYFVSATASLLATPSLASDSVSTAASPDSSERSGAPTSIPSSSESKLGLPRGRVRILGRRQVALVVLFVVI